jgi:hypothetical protein
METARCSCGQLQMHCEGNPDKISACHCLECQRRTGSAFGVAIFFDQAATSIQGNSTVFTRTGDSGQHVVHHFCPACGSTVFWYPAKKAGTVAVALGCFGDTEFAGPTQAVYESRRHPWVDLRLISK